MKNVLLITALNAPGAALASPPQKDHSTPEPASFPKRTNEAACVQTFLPNQEQLTQHCKRVDRFPGIPENVRL